MCATWVDKLGRAVTSNASRCRKGPCFLVSGWGGAGLFTDRGLLFSVRQILCVWLNLPELNPELLIESTTPTLIGVTWDDPDRINLSDEDGKAWMYDFGTKELQPVP